jgi:hypothetical protein
MGGKMNGLLCISPFAFQTLLFLNILYIRMKHINSLTSLIHSELPNLKKVLKIFLGCNKLDAHIAQGKLNPIDHLTSHQRSTGTKRNFTHEE